jgi:putative ABC transport system permease protein
MGNLWQDIRYSVRTLLKNPAFLLIALLTLALSIGANTAIFSVVNAVLLKPLPFAEPDRLAAILETDPRKPGSRNGVSYPNFFDWRAQSKSFGKMASYYSNDLTLTGIETPVHLRSAVVSADLFPLLGVKPQLGRWFLAEEEKPGSGAAVVISHGVWQKQFKSDPNVIGRGITLSGKPFGVVGVAPAGFRFPIEGDPVELWVTSALDAERAAPDEPANTEQRGAHFLSAIGRLKPGVTIEQAQAELDLIASNLEKQYPDTNTNRGVRLIPYHKDLVRDYRLILWTILGAVGCVLLIACTNIANLLLAFSTARYKEITVRAALGASRLRIVRQLLTESLVLSLGGGLLGLLVAWGCVQTLIKMIPEGVPRLYEVGIDGRMLGFTLLVSTLTGVLFGLAPALQSSKIELTEAMKEGSRGAGTGGRQARLRSLLVIMEIALTIVLTVSAGLLLQTFRKLQQVELGFNARNVLTAAIELPARYNDPGQSARFFRTLLAKLKTLPGVESASAVTPQPLSGGTFMVLTEIEGRNIPKAERPRSNFRIIGLDYFDAMKIALVGGRGFTDRDDYKAPGVVIVNESFAKKHFPGDNPLGKRIRPGVAVEGPPQWREIVGVVKDVKHHQSLGRDYEPELYVPHAQIPIGNLSLVVRTNVDPQSLAGAVQREVSALDSDIPIYRIKTLEQYLGVAEAQPKFNALLLSLFAGLALILTVMGLYGVMAYSVIQRTREIGVRLALGAEKGAIAKMVLRRGLALTAVGLAIGLGATFALTRLMSGLLFGVGAADPLTFAGMATLMTIVTLLACYVPARRAANVDPMVSLRYE